MAPNVPFPYPPKTSENRFFQCFQGVEKGCIGNECVNVPKFVCFNSTYTDVILQALNYKPFTFLTFSLLIWLSKSKNYQYENSEAQISNMEFLRKQVTVDNR